MLRKGCTEVPKVSEIVHEAGITNQAFYRHFRSRDDVIVATYEQGMLSVYSYLRHRVGKKSSWRDKLEAWIDGVLAQIKDPKLADLSTVIRWNVAQIAREKTEIEPMGQERIRALLLSILTEAGMEDLDRQALFVNTLVSGIATHYIDSGRVRRPRTGARFSISASSASEVIRHSRPVVRAPGAGSGSCTRPGARCRQLSI